MNPTAVVAYVALFALVGFVFIFAALLVGRFLRAYAPSPNKQEIYECGETPVGSGFVQFDLRFYVVALLFIIFDVEVAFFFPWATVYGKAVQLLQAGPPAVVQADGTLSAPATRTLQELGVARPSVPTAGADQATNTEQLQHSARQLALTAIADIGVFFGVLLLGFAYVWSRGDLNWVRAPSRSVLPSAAEPGAAAASIAASGTPVRLAMRQRGT